MGEPEKNPLQSFARKNQLSSTWIHWKRKKQLFCNFLSNNNENNHNNNNFIILMIIIDQYYKYYLIIVMFQIKFEHFAF